MDDLKIREFRNTIIAYINQVELPIEVKRLSLEEILSQVDKEAERVIKQQIIQREAEIRKAEQEKDKAIEAPGDEAESEVTSDGSSTEDIPED